MGTIIIIFGLLVIIMQLSDLDDKVQSLRYDVKDNGCDLKDIQRSLSEVEDEE